VIVAFNRKDIQYLRSKGGWSVLNFAKLLGVAPNTVYRWERAPKEPSPGPPPTLPIEPMQASILTVIDQAAITKKKAEEIEIFMTLDGPLRGLYALLQLYYGRAEQPKQPKRGEPEVCPEVASAASARGRHALPAHDEDLVTGEDDDG
jgi:transcriptional regulator with XRE-family HTH domain